MSSSLDTAQGETLRTESPPSEDRSCIRLPFRISLLDILQTVPFGLNHEESTHDGAEQGHEGEEVVGAET